MLSNNDILRRVRYLFDFSDADMMDIFKLADFDASRSEVCDWLKPEEDEALVEITDRELATFLNGLIVKNRGKREGPQPVPEKVLNNNIILRKMKIALELRAEDIVDMFALIGKKISKHELSAFFRHPDNKSYQPCLDQYLRNFFNALQAKYKPKNA